MTWKHLKGSNIFQKGGDLSKQDSRKAEDLYIPILIGGIKMKAKFLVHLAFLFLLISVLITATHINAGQKASGLDRQFRCPADMKAVPDQLSYQGFLADATDSSAVTATLEMTFRLFDSETKGAELWSETHPTVAVQGGLFQVLLGSVTPFPAGLFDGSALWLQTEAGAEVFSPRKPLASVAYSHRSNSAEMLLDLTLTDLDDRWVNEEDLNHLDAADGDPADAVYVDAAGEVGIGTISPDRNLHIYDDANGVVGIDIENPNTGSSSTEMITFTDENGGVAGIGTYDEGHVYPSAMRIYNNRPNGTIGLLTAALERVRINNDGKVGIGTISPGYTLDVNGDVNATSYWGDGSHLTGISGTTDNDWTISGSDIYSTGSGNVGIGTTAPDYKLHIIDDAHKALRLGTVHPNSSINILANPSGAGGLQLWVDGGANFIDFIIAGSEKARIASNGKVGIGTASPMSLLDVAGNIQADSLFLGSATKAGQNGGLLLYNGAATDPVVELGDHLGYGGKVNLFDMSGSWSTRLEPDVNGSGGFLEVERNGFNYGFFVDGNSAGTEEPWVRINGSSRTVDFVMSSPGDSSVMLPTGSVSAGEIKDEPGVSNSLGPDFFLLDSGHITYAIDSVTIDIPAGGYVGVTAGCYLNLWHYQGSETSVEVAIDKTPANASFTFPGAQVASVPASADTNLWQFPCTSTRLYEESSAGAVTYYLNVYYFSGDNPGANIARSYIRATYYPTLYGTVTIAETEGLGSDLARSRTLSDGSQRALEPARRSITVEDHNARLEAEMAALRAELESLKKEVRNQRQ
jgi:hypothetical protein